MRLFYAILLLFCNTIYPSFRIIPSPICTVYTPNSILNNKEKYKLLFVGDRTRYSTCTGATWFHHNYLAILNLMGKKIITYSFNPEEKTFTPLQTINQESARLGNAENLVVSPDGTLLAVASDGPFSGINLYSIDLKTHLIEPTPIFSVTTKGVIHNVRFSSDGNYLAMVGWSSNSLIRIYRILRDKKLDLQLTYQKQMNEVLKPKGFLFTKDNQFVVICYSAELSSQKVTLKKSLLDVYKFNKSNGSLEESICSIEENSFGSMEDLAFLNNDHAIIVSDQANDLLKIYPFNPKTGQIDNNYSTLQNPEAQLSFPHGMGVSDDGKYLAATNYGDDSFNLYQIY